MYKKLSAWSHFAPLLLDITRVFLKLTMVMLAPWSSRLFFFFLFVLMQTDCSLLAQTTAFPVKDLVKKLGAKNAPLFSGVSEILSAMTNEDSVQAMQKFKELENNGNASNRYFICRLNLVMGMYFRDHRAARKLVNDIMTRPSLQLTRRITIRLFPHLVGNTE